MISMTHTSLLLVKKRYGNSFIRPSKACHSTQRSGVEMCITKTKLKPTVNQKRREKYSKTHPSLASRGRTHENTHIHTQKPNKYRCTRFPHCFSIYCLHSFWR
uniref:Uncharacterized protein n=1 Tax=Trypanosoma congolense (strain IL3000) TaxID=1068625 RepID=G0V023_TRYCI|nr:hypothetical protein, unlikely [Trypanosoma congolense IL3000]